MNNDAFISQIALSNYHTRIVGYHLPVDIATRSVKDLDILCSLLKVYCVEGLMRMTFCEVSTESFKVI